MREFRAVLGGSAGRQDGEREIQGSVRLYHYEAGDQWVRGLARIIVCGVLGGGTVSNFSRYEHPRTVLEVLLDREALHPTPWHGACAKSSKQPNS